MMVLLDFQMPKLAINSNSRSSLYYDQYLYKMSFQLLHASSLYRLDQASIDKSIIRYNEMSAGWRWRMPITETSRQQLLSLAAILTTFAADYRRITYSDRMNIYTNNLELLQTVSDLEFVNTYAVDQAVLDVPKNVVLLKHSDYKFRTYFKDRRLDADSETRLRSFLLDRADYFKLTRSFLCRLKSPHRLTLFNRPFVDHCGEHDAVMLNLVVPGIVHKTLPIQAK